ncbi:MAG: DUF1538 domain-containing protein [Dehalococcoides mccartyi]|uniref:DUF1538 domain-containing protein n=1 Tax=Dehalococcoides mccartyi TaxID=61435 RepID=UPI0030F6F241
MRKLLWHTIIDVTKAIGPLIGVIIVLQFTLVDAAAEMFIQFLIGTIMAISGMVLFLVGIDAGILPAGKIVGAGLIQRRSLWLIVAVAFLIGFATTIAEPDVLVLARQADIITEGAVPERYLTYIIGIGVAFFVVMAMLRIILGFRITHLLTASYLIIIILSLFTPAEYVSLAFDSGSVTTGALTAPIVISLGIGFSSVLAGKSAVADGFGLLGLASIGPIIAVMIMGIVLG